MKTLTLTLEEELNILDKYKLTPNELMFIRTLLIFQDDAEEQPFSKCIKILKQSGINICQMLHTLQDKGIITKSYKVSQQGMEFNPIEISINKPFIKSLYKSSMELGKELFEVYPQFGSINNSVVPLRTVAKKFDSLEAAYFKYGKTIGWNPEKHQQIIDLVKWANENNIINMSLASFIVNNSWEDLNALRNGDGSANINYNAIRLI